MYMSALSFCPSNKSMSQLLGLPNHDIDLAINNQSGAEFAKLINDFLAVIGEVSHTVTVIQVCS